MKSAAALCLALSIQVHVNQAAACGATPEVVEALLPLPDATKVPLDTALIGGGLALQFGLAAARQWWPKTAA